MSNNHNKLSIDNNQVLSLNVFYHLFENDVTVAGSIKLKLNI